MTAHEAITRGLIPAEVNDASLVLAVFAVTLAAVALTAWVCIRLTDKRLVSKVKKEGMR